MNKIRKIAVVDDDRSMRDALSGLVRSIGMAVVCYASADEFLATTGYTWADCIITDVQMPGMSGIELLEHLRRERITTPVIVVTGHASPSVQARAAAAGNASFMAKPFDGNEMVNRIELMLANT